MRKRKVTYEIVPTDEDYLALPNQIARSAHKLSVMQARLVYLMMAQVRPEHEKFQCVEMKIGDIARALGLESHAAYDQIRDAVDGAMRQVLHIDTEDGWRKFHWFSTAEYIASRDVLLVEFDCKIAPFILGLQKAFQVYTIADLSKLHSRFGLRIFEIVMANAGFAGMGGNKRDEWFVDLQFDLIRKLFCLEDKYKLTKDFRINVLDNPIKEINEADLGIQIECDYEHWRRGGRLDGVRFNCRFVARNKARLALPTSKTEKDDEAFIAQNRQRFDELLAEVKQDQVFLDANARSFAMPWMSDSIKEEVFSGEAFKRLQAEVAEHAEKRASTKKAGSKRKKTNA